jgi:indolepyruvate ferredoxin oxidoreductase
MTGGQANEGGLNVPQIARQVAAEGASRVVVVTDEPWKYPKDTEWPRGLTVHHRDELDAVQRELATVPGVSVLIYDQTCAAEKRRRRKRGTYPDPEKRVVINDLVCEGCGDCGTKSNCVSVQPLETEWGRKRTIDQSSCNKDYSCVKGFCPSFVTVHGARLKKAESITEPENWPVLRQPSLPLANHPYSIIVTGVGGTGTITAGAIIAMAAHIDGKGAGVIDMTGLAQKGGAVYSHIRIANTSDDIHAIRVPAGGADLVIGGDIVVTGNKKVLTAMKHGGTHVVVNTAEFLPGDVTRKAAFSLPKQRLKRAINEAAGRERSHFVDAGRLATALLGQSIGANMFMLGYAYQLGALPLSAEAIERAIEMNGEAVPMNLAAFRYGRRAVVDPSALEQLIGPRPEEQNDSLKLSESFTEMVDRRAAYLAAYQSKRYARRYRNWVEKARNAEIEKTPGERGFAEAVARYLFKLMAYKDEYEVARLYADTGFIERVKSSFDGDLRFEFHLAPPLTTRRDPLTGEPKKKSYGPGMLKVFKVLAKLKFLRGTPFDIFGYSRDRRTERRLVADYRALLTQVMAELTPANHRAAVALASLPEKIRGYGPVKQRHLAAAKAEEASLREQFQAVTIPLLKAAE